MTADGGGGGNAGACAVASVRGVLPLLAVGHARGGVQTREECASEECESEQSESDSLSPMRRPASDRAHDPSVMDIYTYIYIHV